MDVLLIRFDAPLMSFGAPIIDNRGEIQPFPALSMLTGLFGNALGFEHREFDRLQRLQERIDYASRQDRRGERIEDYQTVDLGADYMSDDNAWTTDGSLEKRAGGSGASTHLRFRDYWAGAIHTLAVSLTPSDESPDLAELGDALREPERPLFIGRKTCLPAGDLYLGRLEAPDLVSALERAPVPDVVEKTADEELRVEAWCSVEPDSEVTGARPVTDRRDWANQIHAGERWIARTTLEIELKEDDDV